MFFKVVNVNDFSDDEISFAYSQLPISQKIYIDKKTSLNFKQSIVARIIINDLLKSHFEVNDGYNLSLDNKNRTHYNNDEFYISISHSGFYVACAVSEKKIGIDIQVYKNISDELINKVCTDEEVKFIKSTDRKRFFDVWTAKEAFTKYSGKFLYDIFKISFVNCNKICLTGKEKFKILQFNTEDYALTIVE